MSGGINRNTALETISAAASAIASVDDRVPRATTVQKRRWWSRCSIFMCFRSSNHEKRIRHSVLVPEPVVPIANSPAHGYPARPSLITLPFIAPPSSPASFIQSEPQSSTQSPVGLLSLSPIPQNFYYSPPNRPSIFAIGPYAHETQLVSPPVLSTYTTEPSTAPITPPAESSIHLTTPSSPEVPFARLFNSSLQTGDDDGRKLSMSTNYEFQFYQLPPGSPLGQLISPGSAISGSGPASPFPDSEPATRNPRFLQFPVNEPPKLLSPGKFSSLQVPKSRSSAKQGTPHPHQQLKLSINGADESWVSVTLNDRNAEHVIRCVEQKLRTSYPDSPYAEEEDKKEEADGGEEHLHHQSASLGGSINEFKFSTDEKTLRTSEADMRVEKKNEWSFFPIQPGTLHS